MTVPLSVGTPTDTSNDDQGKSRASTARTLLVADPRSGRINAPTGRGVSVTSAKT